MEHPPIEPIVTPYRMRFLSQAQLDDLQAATLSVLEEVGVQFYSERARTIFAEHGADVNHETQIVKIPRNLVRKAISTVPRYPVLGARDPGLDLVTQDGVTYFTSDGCGHQTVDFFTGETRASTKADLAMIALI